METIDVRPIEPYELDTWDAFVARSPQGTPFHSSVWQQAVQQGYGGCKLLILGAFTKTGLAGGCVLLDRRRFGIQTAVTPLSTPYLGFLLEEPTGAKLSDRVSRHTAVLKSMADWLMKRYGYQNLVCHPELLDVRPLQQAGYRIIPKYTYELNLKLPLEEIWQSLDGSVRRQITKARAMDYEVTANLDPNAAAALYCSTFAKRGKSCPVPDGFFKELICAEYLRPCRHIYAAMSGGKLESFVVLFSSNNTLYYSIAATAQDSLAGGVSSLLIWAAVDEFAGKSWRALDFVGANIKSIARFKEGFNPVLKTYFQVEHLGSTRVRLGKSILGILRKK